MLERFYILALQSRFTVVELLFDFRENDFNSTGRTYFFDEL